MVNMNIKIPLNMTIIMKTSTSMNMKQTTWWVSIIVISIVILIIIMIITIISVDTMAYVLCLNSLHPYFKKTNNWINKQTHMKQKKHQTTIWKKNTNAEKMAQTAILKSKNKQKNKRTAKQSKSHVQFCAVAFFFVLISLCFHFVFTLFSRIFSLCTLGVLFVFFALLLPLFLFNFFFLAALFGFAFLLLMCFFQS